MYSQYMRIRFPELMPYHPKSSLLERDLCQSTIPYFTVIVALCYLISN